MQVQKAITPMIIFKSLGKKKPGLLKSKQQYLDGKGLRRLVDRCENGIAIKWKKVPLYELFPSSNIFHFRKSSIPNTDLSPTLWKIHSVDPNASSSWIAF